MARSGLGSKFGFVLAGALVVGIALWAAFGRGDDPVDDDGWTIGMISNNPNGLRNIEGFRTALQGMGFGEAEGAVFLFSGEPTNRDDLRQAITQMVADGADLIFTAGTPTGIAAHEATRESGVSVIFGVVADPITAGIMTDLTRPGGNMTGVMLSQNQARRLQHLQNVAPQARRILLPYNPDDPAPVSAAAQLDETAEALGLTLIHAHARNDDEVTALLADPPEDIDAIFMLPDSTVNRRVGDLLRVAVERRLPVSGPSTAQVEAGATMAYGIVHKEVGAQAARIAARVLRGADPAETPVETADYYLMLNIAAADRIGLDLSEAVLQQADAILRADKFSE